MAEPDHDSFDAEDYLRTRFGNVEAKDRVQFQLIKLHELFQSFDPRSGIGPKVLEVGCGPVIQHGISVAAFTSEIVFSDISSSNREAIQKWLDGDADAFNWSPHFDYVVKTLEGKGEKEAREREQRMRKISKVVYCDALSETPMEKGYEGPYDIILECECLDAACSDKQTFEKCIKVLHSLLKPGGTLVRVSANAITDMDNLVYSVGGKERTCIRLTHEYVARIMTENGFQDIEIAFSPLDPDTSGLFHEMIKKTANGYHFISARK